MNRTAFQLQPTGDSKFFYSGNSREPQCIGHLRGYFDNSGMFISNWQPHEAHGLNTPEFKAEFQDMMNTLRQSVLANLHEMRTYINQNPHSLEDQGYYSPHGYFCQTPAHDYYIRCNPLSGDYNVYIYVYIR